jgi:hypothetical protein
MHIAQTVLQKGNQSIDVRTHMHSYLYCVADLLRTLFCADFDPEMDPVVWGQDPRLKSGHISNQFYWTEK